MTLIPFSEWRPDLAELNGGTTGDVLNVLCSAQSYIPFPDFVALTGALAAEPLGYFTARSLSGQITIFAGTATKLYKLDNTDFSWDDVSKSLTTYSANTTSPWCFEQFGEYIVAVNANDNPQVFQLGVSSAFDDLGGSPPKAAFVKAWGDFLCLLRLTDNPNRVHWSALNDITGWTAGTDNSDFQDFPEGGTVQGSSRSTNPLIFLESAIYRGTFVPGSDIIFSFVKVHDKRGAAAPYAIASRGEFTFFVDVGGFYQIGPDGSVGPIGFEKVDRTIFGQLASADIATMRGAIDPFYTRVYWTMDLGGTGKFSTILVYDWQLERWSQAMQENTGIFPAATAGYTLEGLDNISSSLDALPYSLDSKVWQGGAPVLAAFSGDYKLGFFNGAPKTATITTQEQGDVAGGVTLVTSVYPVVDTNDAAIALGTRMRRGDEVVWGGNIDPNASTGRCAVRSASRFQRVKMMIFAGTDWSHAQGVDVTVQRAGSR